MPTAQKKLFVVLSSKFKYPRRPEDWFPSTSKVEVNNIVQQVIDALTLQDLITVDTTITTTTFLLLVDASGGPETVNLPTAATMENRVLNIKKIDSSMNAVTIDGDGSETIDGALTVVLTDQWENLELMCDGNEWFVLGRLQDNWILE